MHPVLAVTAVPAVPRFPAVLGAWQLEPVTLALLAASVVLYLAGVRRVAELHPRNPWPRARTWSFLTGLGAIGLALLSPIDPYAEVLFSVHMVQHMLLTMVAAPLLVLGTPVSLLVRAAGRARHRRVMRVLRSWPVTVLTNPVVAWVGYAAVMWGTHLSGLYDAALRSAPVHAAEHALFLVSAVLLWWPVVGLEPSHWRLPHPLRVGYVFLQSPVNTFLALVLYSSNRVLYPAYAATGRAWGPTPLDDLHAGAAIMWIGGDLVFLAATVLGIAAWMRHEDVVTARIDAELAAQRARAAAAEPPAPGPGQPAS
ncbi:MAG TPA: cytochrome c oxidase assembly protein [Actinomycetes bacterium]